MITKGERGAGVALRVHPVLHPLQEQGVARAEVVRSSKGGPAGAETKQHAGPVLRHHEPDVVLLAGAWIDSVQVAQDGDDLALVGARQQAGGLHL